MKNGSGRFKLNVWKRFSKVLKQTSFHKKGSGDHAIWDALSHGVLSLQTFTVQMINATELSTGKPKGVVSLPCA